MAFLVTRSNLWCYFVPTYKIWAKSINPGRSHGYFSKIQDGGHRHLVLRKWWFWSRFLLQGVILHQRTEFDDNPPIHGIEIARWWNQNGSRRHLELWLDGIFGKVFRFMMVLCTYTQNLNQIPPSWAKLWLFFAKSKMAAVRHFGIVMTSFMTIRVE